MKKAKLVIYVLERRRVWSGKLCWVLAHQSGAIVLDLWGSTRRQAEKSAAKKLMGFFGGFGQRSELRIRNSDGTFSPARTYPRSADPKRSKG